MNISRLHLWPCFCMSLCNFCTLLYRQSLQIFEQKYDWVFCMFCIHLYYRRGSMWKGWISHNFVLTGEITSVVNVSLSKTNLRPSGRRVTGGDTGKSCVREWQLFIRLLWIGCQETQTIIICVQHQRCRAWGSESSMWAQECSQRLESAALGVTVGP